MNLARVLTPRKRTDPENITKRVYWAEPTRACQMHRISCVEGVDIPVIAQAGPAFSCLPCGVGWWASREPCQFRRRAQSPAWQIDIKIDYLPNPSASTSTPDSRFTKLG